jgi:hypothetical protein
MTMNKAIKFVLICILCLGLITGAVLLFQFFNR